MRQFIPDRQTFWRQLTNFWTLVFFAVIIIDFIYDNALNHADIILPVAVIYSAVLAIYSAEKEFKRWHDHHTGRHPGEVYTILWTVIIIGVFIARFVFHTDYEMPHEVSGVYVVVISILAITKESKALYRKGKKDTRPR